MQQQLAEIQSIVEDVLKLAKDKGATQAEASMSKVEGIAVSSRLKEVETVEFTNDGGLGITVYHGKKKGSASTADLSPQALKLTVEKAIEIAKHTGDDECSGLADKELMAYDFPELDLFHPVELDTEYAIQQVIAAETSALNVDPRITNSDGASYNANLGTKVYGNSHGLLAGYNSSRYSMSCVVIGEQNGEMQRDYSYAVGREVGMLTSPEQLGLEAAQFTLGRLGARKVKTCKVPVLFDREIAAGLFGHFISAISGGNLYRKSSFLLDQLSQQVLPSWLNITERPHILKGLASSPFDHEGVKTQDMDVVTNGLLNHYLLTSYSARKLKMQTTGHAGGIHNWFIQHTGDYSRGAAGFWVENGVIQYPVHEITIAGNLSDMLKNIVAIGAEQETRGSVQTGSVLIENMQIAGE